MNNNQMNFDPITGQPINQNINNTNNIAVPNQGQQVNIQPIPTVQPISTVEPVPTVDTIVNTQQQMQNIPTVEQSKQDFISNAQANNAVQAQEKKEGPNITFIIILFVIILAAIFFLFPYLLKVL